jgi:HPr kinase/phosphorylase
MPGTKHCLHGVLLVIDPPGHNTRPSCGVLLRGQPGIGKSHCALALLDRGHALVADDAPLFNLHNDGYLLGTCPASIQDRMEVRGLGIINVRQLLGAGAVLPQHRLDIIIELVRSHDESASLDTASQRRLEGHWQNEHILGIPIPALTLCNPSATMLAILVEAAVRNYGLWQSRV